MQWDKDVWESAKSDFHHHLSAYLRFSEHV